MSDSSVAASDTSSFAFYAGLGCVFSTGLASLGSSYAVSQTAIAVFTVGAMKPDVITKGLLAIVMGAMLGLYALVNCIFLIFNLKKADNVKGLLLQKGYLIFSSGLVVGLGSLFTGYGIGNCSNAALRGIAQQEKLFFAYVLSLLFLEALALYAFVISFIFF